MGFSATNCIYCLIHFLVQSIDLVRRHAIDRVYVGLILGLPPIVSYIRYHESQCCQSYVLPELVWLLP